ncbi:uncharacterized protein K489DRAFT_431235 [Dissoconium aciculare CBS 342.82]|uniref:Uncharacterized protein n=1 Tax=Dissoconium aciculare CBS 342.82 TaxID=1314786 RepID=A0A6J3M7C2_9PEZI|nr:uncharacterized protein K489DRAFT_431235 [Dissoconium aciculare CBS 342.82]KAF1823905.1 hypothetical protein K489DRAFT_431235 [Dissoconium aciculare CBS 342.82]
MRAEDLSYCLLSIMGVSMNIRYGDGADKTREQLLHKITKRKGEAVSSEFSVPFSLQGIPATEYFVPRKLEIQPGVGLRLLKRTREVPAPMDVVQAGDDQGRTKDDQRLQLLKASLYLDVADDQLAKEIVETRADKAVTNINQLLPKLGGLPLALA